MRSPHASIARRRTIRAWHTPLILVATLMAGVDLLAQAPATDARGVAGWRRIIDGWKAPTPPRHLIANIHYVGAVGVSAFLITTPEGHILLDTGLPDTPPIIERGVQALGFKVEDIKFLLSSHAHFDHVGGLAEMQRRTRAQVVASPADARTIESGGRDDFIPIPMEIAAFEPARVDRIVRDGDTISLGGTVLTAHLTPGHTRGSTTWTMEINEGSRPLHVVFFSSASINDPTPLLENPKYPEIVADFTASFEKWKALPCDVFFAPHGGQFAMAAKLARLESGTEPNPFIDSAGYKAEIAQRERAFLRQLNAERAAAARKQP